MSSHSSQTSQEQSVFSENSKKSEAPTTTTSYSTTTDPTINEETQRYQTSQEDDLVGVGAWTDGYQQKNYDSQTLEKESLGNEKTG